MAQTPEPELQQPSGAVNPPSFCRWELLLAVMVISEICVVLMGLGKEGFPGWRWFGLASLYTLWLALFCSAGLCITRGWTGHLSPRGAWVGHWLIALVLAGMFSLAAGLSGWVPGVGTAAAPGSESVTRFVLESIFAVAVIAAAFLRYLLIRSQWRAEMMAQAEARVQALQARIQPHFLFNSLNTIASLIPHDPANAEAATLDLADIFRGSMRRADQPISLADELQLARQYLDMEQRRLGERLDIEWRVSELPAGAAVLPLMLQPLLENAVAYGVQPRAEGGRVTVYGRAEGDQVVVTITNPVAPEGSSAHGNGMAIGNIRERLRLAFGADASLITYATTEQFYAVLSLPYVEHTDR